MVPQKRTSRSTLSGQTRRSRRPTGRRRGGPWGACFACLAAGLLASASAGCSSADSAATHHDRHSRHNVSAASHRFEGEYPIQIVTTVGQVAEMMKRIGGEHVEVTALMGPGIDPHLYKPLPKDVSAMSGADAIFYVGMHLEGRMTEIFERMARQRLTYPVTAGLK